MEALTTLLDGLSLWCWWLLVVILLLIETFTNTTYLLWPAAAAAMVALFTSILSWGWEMQLASFAVLTVVLTVLGDRFVARRWLKGQHAHETLNQRAAQLAGQKVVATTEFVAGRGRVKVGDSVWLATLAGDVPVAQGEVVEVVGYDGATLRVRPAGGSQS
jgi:membrane protein implicated in regulation of membrane protease activity